MSNLDLTEAVEAAARGSYTDAPGDGPAWDDLPPMYRHQVAEIALSFVAHAAPLIEAQVREKVAAAIEARQYPISVHIAEPVDAWRDAQSVAARIARGETS